MKCVLMNKDTEVAVVEYDTTLNGFSSVYEIKDINFAPLIVKKRYEKNSEDLPKALSNWFRNRGIPAWRDQLDLLLSRLGVSSPEELLDKSFGLSLSDQYWLKPADSDIKHADINFFDHDFDSVDFLNASFSSSGKVHISEASLRSPNNTTDGMLKKTWVIQDGVRYLLKGGFKGDILQPFNEAFASLICDRLGFDHVPYTLDVVKEKVVSKCACITTKDTEIIPAAQIMFGHEAHEAAEDYETYIRLLEEAGIVDAREQVENMIALDFLIMNEDRHLNNFGVIRDINTLEWLKPAPIFDNGQALNIISYEDGEVSVINEGRFFYGVESYDDMLKNVRDLSRFDFSRLDGIVDECRELLKNYQEITGISNGRIDALSALLSSRIEKIKSL